MRGRAPKADGRAPARLRSATFAALRLGPETPAGRARRSYCPAHLSLSRAVAGLALALTGIFTALTVTHLYSVYRVNRHARAPDCVSLSRISGFSQVRQILSDGNGDRQAIAVGHGHSGQASRPAWRPPRVRVPGQPGACWRRCGRPQAPRRGQARDRTATPCRRHRDDIRSG